MSYIMEEEIKAQKEIIKNLVKQYVQNYCVKVDIPSDIKKVVIVASGSSFNAGLFGKNFFEEIAQVETSVEHACEFSNSKFENYSKDNLYVFISQSGNSKDAVCALTKAKEKGVKTFAVVNNPDSQAYKLADFKIDINAGLERAIAATKSFSATVFVLWLMAVKFAQNKQLDVSDEIKDIELLEKTIVETTQDVDNLEVAAKLISKQKNVSIIGHAQKYAMACEAALKIKETSYVNTSPYPIGEFIHGHFATLNEANTFMTFLDDSADEFELNLLKKVQTTYKTNSIVVSNAYEDYNCDVLVKYPKSTSKIGNTLNAIIALQMLALETAKLLKRDVDNPKGLCKVVSGK